VQFAGFEFPGRHIDHRQPQSLPRIRQRRQIVVGLLVQHGSGQDGSRRNDPRHFPLHQTLGLGRVFRLLTNGDGETALHQAANIIFSGVVRNARHGHFRGAPAPGGESKVQNTRGGLGVLKEHFIKVPEAEKEHLVLVDALHFKILPHHRR